MSGLVPDPESGKHRVKLVVAAVWGRLAGQRRAALRDNPELRRPMIMSEQTATRGYAVHLRMVRGGVTSVVAADSVEAAVDGVLHLQDAARAALVWVRRRPVNGDPDDVSQWETLPQWPRWYAVTVTVGHRTADGCEGRRSLPTFFLDGDIQGIVSEAHAARIARDVVSGDGLFDSDRVTFHVHAYAVDRPGELAGDHCDECHQVIAAREGGGLANRPHDPACSLYDADQA